MILMQGRGVLVVNIILYLGIILITGLLAGKLINTGEITGCHRVSTRWLTARTIGF